MKRSYFRSYAEAQDAVERLRAKGIRAMVLNAQTGDMRDTAKGFEVLIEDQRSDLEESPEKTKAEHIRDIPRHITWLLMVCSALILLSLMTDWLVTAGAQAITILLFGLFGTISLFICAVFWSIFLSDVTQRFRKKKPF